MLQADGGQMEAHAGTSALGVASWRAAWLLERRGAGAFEIGRGYRWQRLSFVMCLMMGLPLLVGAPVWLCLALAAAALLLRDWGGLVGALGAALMVWWGEWLLVTGLLCLGMAGWYGWQALREAPVELIRLAEGDPVLHAAAVARGVVPMTAASG